MSGYNPQSCREKMAKVWDDNKAFAATNGTASKKYYALVGVQHPSDRDCT